MAGEELNPGEGETDLKRMLAALAPAVDARRFSFVLAAGGVLATKAFALIRE
jgi:hypothetical protein